MTTQEILTLFRKGRSKADIARSMQGQAKASGGAISSKDALQIVEMAILEDTLKKQKEATR